jgi:hypothetical protein
MLNQVMTWSVVLLHLCASLCSSFFWCVVMELLWKAVFTCFLKMLVIQIYLVYFMLSK